MLILVNLIRCLLILFIEDSKRTHGFIFCIEKIKWMYVMPALWSSCSVFCSVNVFRCKAKILSMSSWTWLIGKENVIVVCLVTMKFKIDVVHAYEAEFRHRVYMHRMFLFHCSGFMSRMLHYLFSSVHQLITFDFQLVDCTTLNGTTMLMILSYQILHFHWHILADRILLVAWYLILSHCWMFCQSKKWWDIRSRNQQFWKTW